MGPRLLAAASMLCLASLPPADAQSTAMAIINASVIPMDREVVLTSQTVIVEDGTIARIGPTASTDVPAGARVIDGTGRFLMPALAEMHGHIPPASPEQIPDAAIEQLLRQYVTGGIATGGGRGAEAGGLRPAEDSSGHPARRLPGTRGNGAEGRHPVLRARAGRGRAAARARARLRDDRPPRRLRGGVILGGRYYTPAELQ